MYPTPQPIGVLHSVYFCFILKIGTSAESFQSYPQFLKNGPFLPNYQFSPISGKPFPHYSGNSLPYQSYLSSYPEYPSPYPHYLNIPKQPLPDFEQNSPNPFSPEPRILPYTESSITPGYNSLPSQSFLPLNGIPNSIYPSSVGMSQLSSSMKSPSSLSSSYPIGAKGINPSTILENGSSTSPLNSLSASPPNLSGSPLSSSPLLSSSLDNSGLSPLSLSPLSPSGLPLSSSSLLSPSSATSLSHLSPSDFLSYPSPVSPSTGPSLSSSGLPSSVLSPMYPPGHSPSIPFHPKPSGEFPSSSEYPGGSSDTSSLSPSPLGPNYKPPGLTTENYLYDEIFESLRQQYELNRLNYINQNAYPADISGTIEHSTTSLIYDYILLGTGPGSLGALKTLLDTGKRVLLIERGYAIPYQSISLYQRGSLFHSSYVRPVKATAPHVNTPKTIYLPNVLGEETTYDFNYWHNGYRKKYNSWGKLFPKWSWNRVKNYFIGRDENSPDTCPILYTHRIPETQAVDIVTKLFQEIGISPKSYTPGKLPEGLTVLPRLEENGNNVIYVQKVFKSLIGHNNLHLALRTTPKNIVFDVNGRAIGVNVITPYGNERTIVVQDEVIFGSNAIDTVQLLYQSGVGPSEKLLQNNIQPQIDLPAVGKGLLLLPSFNGLLYTFPSETLLNKLESDWASLEYLLGQNQFPSILALNYYKAMLNIYESSSDSNVMINFRVFSKYTKERLRAFVKHFSYVDDSIESFLLELCETRDILFVIPTLTNVQSRGEIYIDNPLHLDEPVIDTGMYESKKDIAVMMKTVKVLISLSQTEAFQTLNGELVQLPIKQCGTPNFSSQYTKCAIRHLSTPNCHFIGGALMGNDPMSSVVNEDLLIYNTQNVRIFNSAVMQYGTGVDSSAVNGMIGNYGAQILVQNVVN